MNKGVVLNHTGICPATKAPTEYIGACPDVMTPAGFRPHS